MSSFTDVQNKKLCVNTTTSFHAAEFLSLFAGGNVPTLIHTQYPLLYTHYSEFPVGEEHYELLEDCGRGVSATVNISHRDQLLPESLPLCPAPPASKQGSSSSSSSSRLLFQLSLSA